jgi:subtilisin family serine protease
MFVAKLRIWCVASVAFVITTVALLNAPADSWKQMIVKCSPEDLAKVRSIVASAVLDSIPGHYLLNVPSTTDVSQIESVLGNGPIEASDNSPISILRRPVTSSSSSSSSSSSGGGTSLGPIIDWYGTPARQGYTTQPASGKIRLSNALGIATGSSVRVAVIDTGVDEQHPTLKAVLWGGKNYVGSTSIPSEYDDAVAQSAFSFVDQSAFSFVDQSAFSFVDQSAFSFVDQSAFSFVDQSSFSFVDQSAFSFVDAQAPAFGHGTMMAGLIHLVAPRATIMPFKAFDASGSGSEWNIVRAIYDAVDSGADVISMSFSSTKRSKLIDEAIQYAASRGIVAVAAAGNDNNDIPNYPAGFANAVGVSALDMQDQKAPFSNFGTYVGLSVLGENLISTYPGGHWAMGSGTSDSVPLVSGVMALVKSENRVKSPLVVAEASADPLQVPPQYEHKLGKGRLDAYNAVFLATHN